MNDDSERPDIAKLMEDDELIERALAQGTAEALRRHKQVGVPIAVWKDGQVVWIAADQIVIDGDEECPT